MRSTFWIHAAGIVFIVGVIGTFSFVIHRSSHTGEKRQPQVLGVESMPQEQEDIPVGFADLLLAPYDITDILSVSQQIVVAQKKINEPEIGDVRSHAQTSYTAGDTDPVFVLDVVRTETSADAEAYFEERFPPTQLAGKTLSSRTIGEQSVILSTEHEQTRLTIGAFRLGVHVVQLIGTHAVPVAPRSVEDLLVRVAERLGSGSLREERVDTDRDGLSDTEEREWFGTDPQNPDTDGDSYSDGEEVIQGFTPRGSGRLAPGSVLEADTDGDGLSDAEELSVFHTDPQNPDTDGDSYSDGIEVEKGYDPREASGTR